MKKWLTALILPFVISSGCSRNTLIVTSSKASTQSVCQWVRETDFTKPIQQSDLVEDDYFNDAVFLGDSRAVGVAEYGVFKHTDVLASVGLSINQWKIKKVIAQSDRKEKITVWDALSLKKYQKVYLIVGYNELGWGYSSVFKQRFQQLVQDIKILQPQAELIVELIYPVSEKGLENEKETSLEKIMEYNDILMQVAKEEEIYFIDPSSVVTIPLQSEETKRVLDPQYTDDGVHLNEKGFQIWKNFVATHTIRRENDEKMVCDFSGSSSIDGLHK